MSDIDTRELTPEDDAGFYEVWRKSILKFPLGKETPPKLAGLIRMGWSDDRIIAALFHDSSREMFKSDQQYANAQKIFRGVIRHARRLALAGPDSN